MGRATSTFFRPRPPGALGRGHKVKYHLISITKSSSKIFIPHFVCVLTNERYNLSPGSCPRGGTLGRWGCSGGGGGQKIRHGHVAYQIDGDE